MATETMRLVGFAAGLVLSLVGVYAVGLPLVRFVHLLGHAVVARSVAGGATVRLGERPRWGMHLGGVTVEVAPLSGTVGFCEPTAALTGRERLAFDLGGPAASLLFVLVAWGGLGLVAAGTLAYLVDWAVWWLATAQLVLCVAPTVAPSWLSGPYAGARSDLHDHYPPLWRFGWVFS